MEFDETAKNSNSFRMRGMISIIIGLILVVGGLTGKLVLIGTNSGVALAVVGGVVVLIGVARLVRSRA